MVPKTVMRRSVLVQNVGVDANYVFKNAEQIQTIYWTNALCETAVILATWAPGFLPTGTLTLLARYPDGARDIRFTATWLSGCLLMHFGSFIRLSCYRALGSNFTWELAVKKGHVLVTTGPYAIVRHPSYVGALSIYVGAFCTIFGPGSWFNECIGWDTTASWLLAGVCGSWALGIPMLLMGRVNREDEVLRREFGEEWEAYAKKVPYKLFPFVY